MTEDRTRHAGSPAGDEPRIIVALEGDRPLAGSARYSLRHADEVVIGRGASRTASRDTFDKRGRLTLQVPDVHISKAHARIEMDGAGFVVSDLGSRNGTWVNGRRIDRASIGDDDVVQVGRTLLCLRRAAPVVPGLPDDEDSSTEQASPVATLNTVLARDTHDLLRAARSNVSVMLLGESGVGKEVFARAIHDASGRTGPFVAINCAAIPPTLVESQLFGHVRGAFSGAVNDHPGLVRAAERGTLFLDEVGDMPKSSQAALLRVLQEREVTPVGGTRAVPVDVRFLAATHPNLLAKVEDGEFREDVYARLTGISFRIPPLRDRREDIGLLIAKLLRRLDPVRAARLTLEPSLAHALISYRWPRNVRELEQALARACAIAPTDVFTLEHFPPELATARKQALERPALAATEDPRGEELRRLLRKHHGNVTEVARVMQTARTQVHRWLRRYGIDPASFRRDE